MSPKYKVLSGSDIIKLFQKFGFEIVSQKGSHVKLKRLIKGQKQVLVIPNHRELDIGTLKSIYRQASVYISEELLTDHFLYSDT